MNKQINKLTKQTHALSSNARNLYQGALSANIQKKI